MNIDCHQQLLVSGITTYPNKSKDYFIEMFSALQSHKLISEPILVHLFCVSNFEYQRVQP